MVDSVVYYVYQIKNNITNSVYIGITKNLESRFREHKNCSNNKYLRAAINVYGIENFTFSVLETTTIELCSEREVFYIAEARKLGNTYNISNGGLIGNGAPKEDHWNSKLTEQEVLQMKELYNSTKITQLKLSELFGISKSHISKILRGERWQGLGVDIKNSLKNKVANKRKLTDSQVTQVREEAYLEYQLFNKIDIPEIAKIYGIARGNMRLILTGKVYTELPGPILTKDYYIDYGRKL